MRVPFGWKSSNSHQREGARLAHLSLAATLVLTACLPERAVRPNVVPTPGLDAKTLAAARSAHFTGVIPTVEIASPEGSVRVMVSRRIQEQLYPELQLQPDRVDLNRDFGIGRPAFDLQSDLLFVIPPAASKYTYNTNSTLPYKLHWECVVNGVDEGPIVAQVQNITHSAIDGTGGHGASRHGQKPHGASQPLTGTTGGDGYSVSTYSASAAAGDEGMAVDWTAIGGPADCIGSTFTDSYSHATRWTGLARQSSSANLTFSTITSDHSDIYYVTPEANAATLRTAAAWRDNTGRTLQLNASSLIFGGINDVQNSWKPPHQAHRTGADVDMDGIPGAAGDTPRVWNQVILTATAGGGFRKCEVHNKDHVHCYSGAVYR